jgi:DNA-nicking Smr family endonuclease
MSRSDRKLSDEDRVLWSLVARSATPLKGRKTLQDGTMSGRPVGEPMPTASSMAKPAEAAAAPPRRLHVAAALDKPTMEKLSRGKLPIEGRVDLHGLTQSEAHSLLLSFLQRAHANGVRYVLVITGKGFSSGGDGILRHQVPAWLSTPPFRALVSSHDVSARHHGGEGALYIRLRKKP